MSRSLTPLSRHRAVGPAPRAFGPGYTAQALAAGPSSHPPGHVRRRRFFCRGQGKRLCGLGLSGACIRLRLPSRYPSRYPSYYPSPSPVLRFGGQVADPPRTVAPSARRAVTDSLRCCCAQCAALVRVKLPSQGDSVRNPARVQHCLFSEEWNL